MGKEPAGIAHGVPPPHASALVARLSPSCFPAAGSWSSFVGVLLIFLLYSFLVPVTVLWVRNDFFPDPEPTFQLVPDPDSV
jgi:hypothetical protein